MFSRINEPTAPAAHGGAGSNDPLPCRRDAQRALREAVAATIVMLGVSALALTGLYRSSARALKLELHDDLIRIASASAAVVDADLHRKLTDPAMIDGELYNRAIEPLRRIRAGTPGVKYVYTAVRDGDAVRFVLDAAIPGDHDGDGREDRAQLLERYNDPDPAIFSSLGEGTAPGVASASDEPYIDEWGVFVTGYAPIIDRQGVQVGIVGVDVAADVYIERLASARRSALLGATPAALLAGAIGVGMFATRRKALASARALEHSRREIAASEARARDLIEGSDIVIWEYDPRTERFTYVSPRVQRMGYPVHEWLVPGFWAAHIHPDDRQWVLAHCREEIRRGRSHRLQYRMLNADGSVIWVDDAATVSVRNGDTVVRGVYLDITERKLAEDGVRELYARLQKIASQVPGVVYQFRLRPDGTSCFPYASDGIRQIYRVEPERVREDAGPVFAVIHPDDAELVRRSIEDSARDLSVWRLEYRVRFEDGAVRWLLGNSVPQREPDGSILWHGFITDVTERKTAEEALLAVTKRFELARRSVRIGVWEWDVAARALSWDEGMRELFDMEPGVATGRFSGWHNRTHPDDRERVEREFFGAVQFRSEFDTTFRVVHANGNVLWLASSGVVVRDAAGAPMRMVGLNIDITRQVHTQEVLARARDQAEAANRAKSLFLANMSHEIRTPLTAILGYADLLRDDGDASKAPPHRIELIETIRTAGRHLLDIINDVLDLSKIEAGKMTVEHVPTPLPEIVGDVETLLRPRADSRRIELAVAFATPVPDRIVSDPTRLRQILMNLAGNAVKFTETGSVTIRLAAAGDHLHVDIEDTGAGMTAEQAQHLFRPFAQADASVTRRHGGTGLGLAICRRLAHLMGGEVVLVRSAPGEGSTFRLDLPLELAPNASRVSALRGVPIAAAPRPAPKSLPIRVLVAEDAIENQRLIGFYLKRAGATVEFADNGEIALERIAAAESAGRPFHLLITDVQMPIMDGCTLSRALRERGNQMPVIALTAHAMAEDRDRCLEAGCNRYATKPIDSKALLAICAELVSGAPDTAAA